MGFGEGHVLMGLTHVLFGLFLFLVFWRLGLVGFDVVVLGALVVGSVLPDLDHPRGLIYSLLGVPVWLRRGVCRVVGQRGILHSLLVAVVVLVLGYLIFSVVLGFGLAVSFGLFVGYLSHLFLDSLTVRGVAWLLPFSHKRVRFVIGTGSMIERIFFYILAIFSVVLVFPLVSELFDMISIQVGSELVMVVCVF
jgi:inner membrane protein